MNDDHEERDHHRGEMDPCANPDCRDTRGAHYGFGTACTITVPAWSGVLAGDLCPCLGFVERRPIEARDHAGERLAPG